LTELSKTSSLYLTPFSDISWLVNQRKSEGEPIQNSVTDVWSTLSYRFGIKLSIDFPAIDDVVTSEKFIPITPSTPIVANKVLVVMPEDNVILTKQVTGYFPVHPYVFFDKGSLEIPNRYTLLTKSEAQNFKESDLENFMKGDLTSKETNIDQLMKTYYNVLNIFGDRLRQNP
jgi:phage pi2 protein 07